jgi:hypothetical protein
MKFFRVHLYEGNEGSAGYVFETTLPAARRRVAEFKRSVKERPADRRGAVDCDIDPIEVEPNKTGILKALNRYAGHPDNG